VQLVRLDHFVRAVASIEATCDFYHRILGMEVVSFGQGRRALKFGQQKINLHQEQKEFEPKATRPTEGSGDFCLITEETLENVAEHLNSEGIEKEDGPVRRTGALGPITSVYFRDPDGNLVEVSTYE